MKFSEKLGEGRVIKTNIGETIFKLDSYEKNPIIKPRNLGLTWNENSEMKIGAVFNGGAELFEDKIILLPRCHKNYIKREFFDSKIGMKRVSLENYISEICPLVSKDGINFTIMKNVVIKGDGTEHKDFIYGIEDIRIIKYKDGYLLIGCGKIKPSYKGANADRIAIYTTKNFVNIKYRGIVKYFDLRDAVPFSEPINGKHYILLRFHNHIHLDVLEAGSDQMLNPIKYKELWKKIYEQRSHSLLLEAGSYPHEREKIGPGTQLIKTKKGWLLIYHAVGEIDINICKAYGLSKKINRAYSICAAILDLNDPRKVICRTRKPIYIPSAPYELNGNRKYPVDVPAVVFPTGIIIRNDKLVIYSGAGDKYIILLSCSLVNLLNYLFKYCKL